jgi:heterotetrameric sarcosine oxidase delta subunit
MLLIPCPYCGEREETEFSFGDEAHIDRPAKPEELSDEEWAQYVFMHTNPKGVHFERWVHTAGCRKWFNVVRDTVSYKILAVYEMGKPKPKIEDRREI